MTSPSNYFLTIIKVQDTLAYCLCSDALLCSVKRGGSVDHFWLTMLRVSYSGDAGPFLGRKSYKLGGCLDREPNLDVVSVEKATSPHCRAVVHKIVF